MQTPEQPPYQHSNDGSDYQSTGWTIADWYGSVQEGNRSYHGYMAGLYSLPNDGKEQNRLDMQHTCWQMVLNDALNLAPIGNSPSYVLDVGTGTGIWANDFAERHPRCAVIGTDLSLIQPHRASNVTFVMEDAENQDWVFPWLFDYIHFRHTFTSFKDVRKVMQRAYDHLQPGGWIEFQETPIEFGCVDGTLQGTPMDHWANTVIAGLAKTGTNGSTSRLHDYKDLLIEIGFADVQFVQFPCPGNGWMSWNPKKQHLGMLTCLVANEAVDAYTKIYTLAGLSPEKMQDLMNKTKRYMTDRGNHYFINLYVYKPYILQIHIEAEKNSRQIRYLWSQASRIRYV